MLKKTMHSALVLAVVLGLGVATSETAQARRGGGIAAGLAVGTLLGLGIAGAYAGPRYYGECYPGPRQCDWAGRRCWYNRWGEYVCRGGEWRCWRPTICD